MTESLITHLRHVDLAIPDYDRQLAFYTRTWGLSTVASDRGIAFLAAEGSPELLHHPPAQGRGQAPGPGLLRRGERRGRRRAG